MIKTVFTRTINRASTVPSISHSLRCNTKIPRREMSMGTESVVARLKSSGSLQTKGLIGGKWTDAYDGRTIQVNNPASGEVIASVACMGEKETKDAISSAYDALGRTDPQIINLIGARLLLLTGVVAYVIGITY